MFYLKLAITNIKKNGKIYFPYLITSIFTVMMFYSVKFLAGSNGLSKDSLTASQVMGFGIWVVLIFSVIFLLYINSFLMKNRKKEFGLYNILGMEKRHVMGIVFIETAIIYLISTIIGILLGVLFSKLMMMILVKIMSIHTSIIFSIDGASVLQTAEVFGLIYFVSFLINAASIRLSNPITLLKGGQIGEKEPKTKWLLALVGVITLAAGYTIALTIDDPVQALVLFFIAVILVIVGTYALFTAGSIVILKLLKKNKNYYYKTNHFISVSQMMYRMKQNAVGLASICILCTCILVMISTTFTLYKGIDETSRKGCQADYQFTYTNWDHLDLDNDFSNLVTTMKQSLTDKNIGVSNSMADKYYSCFTHVNGTVFSREAAYKKDGVYVKAITLSEYNRIYHQHYTLKDNQVLYNTNFNYDHNSMLFNDHLYELTKVKNDKWFVKDDASTLNSKAMTLVFKDDQAIKTAISKDDQPLYYNYEVLIDYKGDSYNKKATLALNKIVRSFIDSVKVGENGQSYSTNSRYENHVAFSEMYGSLLFLGIFLGVLFMMAAILIMYYKQLSEGYEDQKRYAILQNVGLSEKEVKQAIRSQVLIFFFLPLVVAVIHMSFAYNIILKMFDILIVNAPKIFISCTAVSVIVLAICYSIVYFLTSRTYYKIVK